MKIQSRNSETRANELRDLAFDFDPSMELSVPAGVKREGYSYKYININLIDKAERLGYELVSKERATGKRFINPVKKNVLADSHITLGDTVLGEIPTSRKLQIDAYYNKKANDANKIEGVTDTQVPVNRF